ncbi:polysaccharide deacetylase [Alkalihalobacillus alcalophilus ATCC 27647 = CGMCC 1.3604]|uniref:Polysaccharide deacetylase n=1 Tax=Alkalihalobacillus alcalophilus ATCC 27647 = CGMCC 1.3604 TaxID=1218173 RepID=A0A094YVC3_ALKAL|nr:polysaccharide deacetylase family protein [Alkalihalobacillus alcalophilus]KGA97467.1 polysaccharide deacetylase [Alkalihalobacillus alcalophilus ATCC 27647 = CGMCC 1.3604]MED1563291.1 polysaccharide deacetylase family protein [Alkalihalobacillus alcalophilus]THG92248.1 polysaccharide deacetylase [Alkalihalobacillus alcalophilus ATCC 27647 = CGMCC 1.3604]
MKTKMMICLFSVLFLLIACQSESEIVEMEDMDLVQEEPKEDRAGNEIKETSDSTVTDLLASIQQKKEMDLTEYEGRKATEWGENVTGVKTRLHTEEQVIALTFDACGGPYGSEYDEELISFLREEEIPATLFINKRWIRSNEAIFQELVADPLFEIENHGSDHLPLSINGNEAWGIAGTSSIEEIVEEVLENQIAIAEFTGIEPTFFRSGTAFYDEIAVEIVEKLGLQVVNFDVLGDAGATFSAEQVHQALLGAQPGSIALLHMNQPSSGTAEGVKRAVTDLLEEGYSFVTLSQYDLN